ncbi:Syntaxin-binding protein 3 [Bagarius yarrelli]|uniref:Geranylgeranyl transferase type-2 subunit alpha n=1 Tax=Bagarius yarrelli TaxID=175774 RepID=A0A556U061_BAGYA|nr:Syntaxin-binding protein 3 [Bagarius yarrelli]
MKETIIADCRKSDVWKIMMLDSFTTRLLSSCCKMSDLMSEGITIVEDLFKNREPVLEMKAIYFMSPTVQCVDAFINDFKLKPKYKSAYIYFTDYCPDELFNKMKLFCAKHIKVCKEINISFLPLEAQSISDQIVSLCATLDEYPGVRYRKDSVGDYAKLLAELVDNKLARHYELDENSKKKEKTQAQLIIVDRGFDPVSPILHELTYQAMAYDLIPINNDTYKYKGKDGSEKEALLNENDELWMKLRHMHIAEVTAQIPKLVKEISANKKQPDGKISIGGLAQLMKQMPSFRKQVAQKTVHLTLAEDCMNKFQSSVEKLCKAEQDLAVGSDVEGQKVKDPMRTLLPILLHPHSTYDKIRAVLLYIFSLNGTTDENLNKLIQHVKIETEREYITNWKELGVPINSSSSFFSSRKPSRRDRSQEEMYNLSRWVPVIKDVMEDALDNKLDTRDWPHQSECPSAWNGSRAVSARQKHKPSSPDDYRSASRLIIFILGGVSYSEMRCAYEVTKANKSCEVIIGSTHVLTPTSMLDDIRDLSKKPIETFTLRSDNELDEEALQLTQQLLASNPDFATLWNYRREILLHLETVKEEEELQKLYEAELLFIESCLKVNPKSYGSWHHRGWVSSRLPKPDWKRELSLFHCWDYRRFVVKESGVSAEQELQYTEHLISSNFSNYSSWHYRSTLLPLLFAPQPDPPKRLLLCLEYELVQNAVFTDPNDQSAWFYYRWLLGRGCLLTVILLMRALDPLGHEKETLAHFHTLKEVDPMRSAYYSDLCSKFMIENTILKMEYAEVRVFSLSDKNLSMLCHLDQLLLVTHINLCSNQLVTLPQQVAMLQCLEVLEADDNTIETLEGLHCLPRLEEVSLKNNQISKVSDLLPLATCPKLTRLDLRGNPVTVKNQAEISELLPSLTELLL